MTAILIGKDESAFTAGFVGPTRSDEQFPQSVLADIGRWQNLLQRSERHLNAVLNNTRMAVFVMDELHHCTYMNAAAERLTGYSLLETQGRSLHGVIHHTRPDGSPFPQSECPIDSAFPSNNQMEGEEVFVHKDGSFYPVAYTASPIRNETDESVGTIIEVRDIRAKKARSIQLNLLVDEVNHRVKNTMATVQAIVRRVLKDNDVPKNTRDAVMARLMSLSRSHDLLSSVMWREATVADVVASALEPFMDEAGSRFTISGPNAKSGPKFVLVMGMALHELATNAIKHGALSGTHGHVNLVWDVSSDGHFSMLWEEVGGPPVTESTRKGFGSRLLLEGIRHELGATAQLAYLPTGLRYEVHFILPKTSPQTSEGLPAR